MSVDDHGLEGIRKSAHQVIPGDKSEYKLKVFDTEVLAAIQALSGGGGKITPKIYNVNVLTANTEQSQALSPNAKGFLIRSRQAASLKLAYVTGESATNYLTIPMGSYYEEVGISAPALTLYFQSTIAGIDVEILEWT